MIRSGNPVLQENIFKPVTASIGMSIDKMTVAGTVNKTAILLLLTFLSASLSWQHFEQNVNVFSLKYIGIAAFCTFILAIVIVFKKTWAPLLAPIYCLVQGLFLGAISVFMENQFPGIFLLAITSTFGVFAGLLLAYKFKVVRATENFKLGVIAATCGIAFLYLISFIAALAGLPFPILHSSGPWGIALSVFVVIIAALNLVLDFDFIEKGEQAGAPKYMEWYAAFGLMVTLIWLYMEILRLTAKARRR